MLFNIYSKYYCLIKKIKIMKNYLKMFFVLCVSAFLSACDTAGVESYHRGIYQMSERLKTRYLHEDIARRFADLGEKDDIKKLESGDSLDFLFPKDFYLSYHPDAGYILEIEQQGENSRYFILGEHDFVIKIENRNKGVLRVKSEPRFLSLPPTKSYVSDYVSLGGYVKRYDVSCYLPKPVTQMVLVKYKTKLSFYWAYDSGSIVIHEEQPRYNLVIKSGGDFLSTRIAYEQEFRHNYSRRVGYYTTWAQRDIAFCGYDFEDNQIKEYGFWHKAPQLER